MLSKARTWLDIDLDALAENYRTACSLTEATVTCVLKANAYGLGMPEVAKALSACGCRSFAVSCAREAMLLRKHGIEGEILNMGSSLPEDMPEQIREGISLTAASMSDLAAADLAAVRAGRDALIHLKVDTGFHRLGFTEAEAASAAELLNTLHHVCLQAVYSHLGLIDEAHDRLQFDRLMRFVHQLEQAGVQVPEWHLCDSIGLVRYPAYHGGRVRVGALLYGVRPSRSSHLPFDCLETVTFRTTVAQLHPVRQGDPVGYSDDAPLDHDAMIATLCVGYGDGYPRHLSNGRGKVLIRSRLAPVVGLVCMDQLMVDVTDIPGVQCGDTATLLGSGISYDDFAAWADTNRNECLTLLSSRPLRHYQFQGSETWVDSLLNESETR